MIAHRVSITGSKTERRSPRSPVQAARSAM